MLLFSAQLTAQQQSVEESDLYMKKALGQRKTANILLISGGALVVTGAIVTHSDATKFLISSQQWTGIGITTLGFVTGLSSIPFYLAAGKNKRRSLHLRAATTTVFVGEKSIQTAGMQLQF